MPSVTKKSAGRKRSSARHSGAKKVLVTTEIYGVPEDSMKVEVLDFPVEPAYVSTKVGVTKSIAAYESLRVDVSIHMPCIPHPDVIDATFTAATDHAIDMLDKTIDELTGEG